MTVAALVLGGMFGLSLFAAVNAWWPPRPPLGQLLARHAAAPPPAGRCGWTRRLFPFLAVGADADRLAADLELAGRGLERHLAVKAALTAVGVLAPPALAAVAVLAGLRLGAGSVLGASLLLAAGVFVLPDVLLRREAAQRRRDFTVALGSFLDLTMINLAGGCGVESALTGACQTSRGWAFSHLEDALELAQLSGEPPWTALSRLGERLAVAELAELAASLALAGTEGARVRASLAAKASALRDRLLAAAEADAQADTERMVIPTVLLLTGFVVLIGYPALHAVLQTL